MTITTLSSWEFDQSINRAKKAAMHGPVIITDRGSPAYVLLSIEEYRRISGEGDSIIDLLAMPGVDEIEFDVPRAGGLFHPA